MTTRLRGSRARTLMSENKDGHTQAPEWLTTDELADWLRIPIGTIYDWRAKGEGPVAYRLGRHLRWRRDDVEDWLQDQRAA